MTISLLGDLEVDGGTRHLSPRDRVVLSALSIHPGRSVATAELCDALWGEERPASAGKVVQGCIVRLRRVLGTDAIATTADGYRLTLPPDEVDISRFERLAVRSHELLELGEHDRAAHTGRLALATWNGPALRDLDGWPAGRAEAQRLDALRLDTEDVVLEAALHDGEDRRLVAEAGTRVDEAPRRERRWEVLALAEYRAGRQADALRTLGRAGRTLRNEYGIEPGPQLRALELAILRHDPSLIGVAAAPSHTDSCPYPGLPAFNVDDAEVFFGRDADIAHCLHLLERTGVVAVIGPSGSGKSSLVRAGLAAALRRAGRRVEIVVPGEHPLDSLPPAPPEDEERSHCLVVDQCEEAITRCADGYERAAFFAGLVQWAAQAPLVITLRADYVGEVSTDRSFARLLERGLHLLGPMDADDLAAAIEGPARHVGLRFEPGLVDVLHREVDGAAGSLPLLAHALRQTWEHREGRTLTVAGYRRTGGIRGAVAQTAEALYDSTYESHRPLLRELLLRLVSPNGLGTPHRVRVPSATVAHGPVRTALVERLVEARLLIRDGGHVELAHESLATAWPRLRSWIDDDIDGLRIRRHLAVAADDWERLGRPDSELYRGVRLTRVIEWAQRAHPDLVPVERAFLGTAQSRVAAEQRDALERLREQSRANHRLRLLVAGAAVLLVAALVAGTLAWSQAQRADRTAAVAEARRVGAQALATAAVDRSLLLAVEAVNLDDSAETRASLLTAVARNPWLVRSVRTRDPLSAVAASPDGRLLAIGSATGPTTILDASSTTMLAEIDVPATRLRFSPDGKRLAVVTGEPATAANGRQPGIVLVETATGRLGAPLGWLPTERATDVAFSADGKRLAATFGPEVDDSPLVSQFVVWSLSAPFIPIVRLTMAGHRPRLAMTADASTAYIGTTRTGRSGWVTVIDVASGLVTQEADLDFTPADVSADGRWLAGIDGHDAVVFDATALQERVRLEARTALVQDAWFAPDGRRLVTAGADGAATLWDVRPSLGRLPDGGQVNRQIAVLRGHAGRVADASFSPDGDSLYTVSVDQTLLVWDLAGERRFVGLDRRPAARRPAAPVVRETTAGIEVYAPGTRLPVGGPVPFDRQVRWMFASSDARRGAVLSTDRTVTFLDFETSTVTGSLTADWMPAWAGFSPDGERLAVTGADGEVGVVDVDLVEWVTPPVLAHRAEVAAVTWSPDGRTFVTGGDDGRVGLWDGTTGRLIGVVDVGAGARSVTPSFDDGDVVVEVASNHVYRFDPDVESWTAFACAVAGRNLTRAEWVEAFGGTAPYRTTCSR